ncbi:MAG: hypothetical protein AABX33_06815 [Nanoarchaeota archaeon]
MPTIAEASFYIAFIIDLFIAYYGFVLYRQIKGSSLAKVVMFATLSAFVFGLHHLGEVLLIEFSIGITIAESIESVAALLLLVAVYYIYKISNEVFVAEYYPMENKK